MGFTSVAPFNYRICNRKTVSRFYSTHNGNHLLPESMEQSTMSLHIEELPCLAELFLIFRSQAVHHI
jgi:hypothetical protein